MDKLLIFVYGFFPMGNNHFQYNFAESLEKTEKDLNLLFNTTKVSLCFIPSIFLDRSVIIDFRNFPLEKDNPLIKDIEKICIKHLEVWCKTFNGKNKKSINLLFKHLSK